MRVYFEPVSGGVNHCLPREGWRLFFDPQSLRRPHPSQSKRSHQCAVPVARYLLLRLSINHCCWSRELLVPLLPLGLVPPRTAMLWGLPPSLTPAEASKVSSSQASIQTCFLAPRCHFLDREVASVHSYDEGNVTQGTLEHSLQPRLISWGEARVKALKPAPEDSRLVT